MELHVPYVFAMRFWPGSGAMHTLDGGRRAIALFSAFAKAPPPDCPLPFGGDEIDSSCTTRAGLEQRQA